MENPAIKNGLILGATWIIYNLALYLVNPLTLGGFWQPHLVIIPAIYFMWKSAQDEKTNNNGYISFGEGFKASFLTIIVGALLGLLFKHLMFTVIDPDLPELLKENAIAQLESLTERFSLDEAQMDGAIEAIEEQDFSPSIIGTLSNYLLLLVIPYLPTAAIIGAITKKEDKSFA